MLVHTSPCDIAPSISLNSDRETPTPGVIQKWVKFTSNKVNCLYCLVQIYKYCLNLCTKAVILWPALLHLQQQF